MLIFGIIFFSQPPSVGLNLFMPLSALEVEPELSFERGASQRSRAQKTKHSPYRFGKAFGGLR